MEVKVEMEVPVEMPSFEEARRSLEEAAPKRELDWERILKSWLKWPLVVEFFIRQEEPIDVNGRSTIFHRLASRGYRDTLEWLLTETCREDGMLNNTRNQDGNTALHLAVAKGHYSTVKVLLEKGKVGKHLDRCNNKGETVFHLACNPWDIRGNLWNIDRILMLLLRHAKKEWKNKPSDLHKCLAQRDKECGRTFFDGLMARRYYGLALDVLEMTDPEVQHALEKVAGESEGTHGDTALFLLLKNESSFFATKKGQSDVKQEAQRLVNGHSSNEKVNSNNQPLGGKAAFEWRRLTSDRRTRARLLVKLMHIWTDCLDPDMPVTDTILLYLGNAGLVNVLRPFFRPLGGIIQMTPLDSGENVLQTAARNRMTKFIDWFTKGIDDTHLDWAHAILQSLDGQDRTALHYAAMAAPHQDAQAVGGFASEIKRDYQWFKRIEDIMPPHLVSKKCKPVAVEGSKDTVAVTAEELFILLRKEKAVKHGESARAMANTIMSLVAAVAFATTFTLPNGLVEGSGKLQHKDAVRFTSFVCAYVLGLSFAATTILTSLALYQSPSTVKNFHTSIPRLFRLCLCSFFLSLLFMLVAFCCNLQIAFARYGMTKFTFLYALIFAGPLLVALVYYKFVLPAPTTKDRDL